jgi:hypothetical protein
MILKVDSALSNEELCYLCIKNVTFPWVQHKNYLLPAYCFKTKISFYFKSVNKRKYFAILIQQAYLLIHLTTMNYKWKLPVIIKGIASNKKIHCNKLTSIV